MASHWHCRLRHLQPNLFTYSALATACARGNHLPLALLDEMRSEQLRPDLHFFGSLIAACGADWEVSLDLFQQLEARMLEPSLVTYNATMNCLQKGRVY